MALQKNINLPNGASGNYSRIAYYHLDYIAKESVAHFYLFVTPEQAKSAPEHPLCLIAKIRLDGPLFDKYFIAPGDPRDVFYAAAKVEKLMAGGGLMDKELDFKTAKDI